MKSTKNTSTENNNNKKTSEVLPRRKRQSLHDQSRLMGIDPEPGYFYHLTTDEGNNIQRNLNAGYEIVDAVTGRGVKNKEGNLVERTSDPSWKASALSQSVGGGYIGYMMRIPNELREENEEPLRNRIDKQEADILRNKVADSRKQASIFVEASLNSTYIQK